MGGGGLAGLLKDCFSGVPLDCADRRTHR